jgi:hypothetical protein
MEKENLNLHNGDFNDENNSKINPETSSELTSETNSRQEIKEGIATNLSKNLNIKDEFPETQKTLDDEPVVETRFYKTDHSGNQR